MKWIKKHWILLPLFTAALFTAGCHKTGPSETSDEELKRFDAQFLDLFDTVTSIVGYAEDKETFTAYVEDFYDELMEYHQLYDIYDEYDGINNLKTVNDLAGIRPVEVDIRIIDMLEEAKRMHDLTGGKMNIAMGSVLSLWHDYRTDGIEDPEHAELPPIELLEEAAQHTDIEKLLINREASTVFLTDKDMKLDVGSIAKGYAVEMACRSLEKKGIDHVLVSVGGNVRAVGTRADKSLWRVGIQNPDISADNPYLHLVELNGLSLVTSGTYQRYYTVQGKQYHHIIHPELLMPWDEYLSVSIICRDSGMADCLSTAVFNMNPEDGKALIEKLDGVEAMWVYPDGTEEFSSGFQSFFQFSPNS